MLFVDVEMNDYFYTATGCLGNAGVAFVRFIFSRQCRCFFCAFHIFCKMFEQTKRRNWLSVKWIPRKPNSEIRFLPYFPWCNQTTWIHFPYGKKISIEIILCSKITFRWTKRTLNLKKLINFKEQTKNPKTQETQELKKLKE